MFCLLADTRYFLFQPYFGVLARQRSLVTLTVGRQGAYKHNWCINVLSHNLHLLILAKPELMRTSFFLLTAYKNLYRLSTDKKMFYPISLRCQSVNC
jgi:hypothetical protein